MNRSAWASTPLDVLMAKSRDPKEMQDLWVGWHKVGAPMKQRYARLVELSNQGARETGLSPTPACCGVRNTT